MSGNIRMPDMSPHKTVMRTLEGSERVKSGREVCFGYTKEQAVAEAERCMNCPDRWCAESDKPHGSSVTVIGGGNTAIDAARAVIRTGAESVKILYRRSEEEMPAVAEELALAKEEGVEVLYLLSPARFIEAGGVLSGAECDIMTLTKPDYPGGRKNSAPTGECVIAGSDLAVLALGFENEPIAGLDLCENNRIMIDEAYRTSVSRVYAGGDAVTGARLR